MSPMTEDEIKQGLTILACAFPEAAAAAGRHDPALRRRLIENIEKDKALLERLRPKTPPSDPIP